MAQRPVEMECKFCYREEKTGHNLVCPVVTKGRTPEWVDKYTNKTIKEVRPKKNYL